MQHGALRRMYLRDAAVMLLAARLALALVPLARVLAWASRPPRRVNRFAGDESAWASWAVDAVAARSRLGSASLPRALALQLMLRRRGIVSRLCLGVAREHGALAAHAWIEVAGDGRGGAAEAGRFIRLAEFGGAPG